MIRLNKINPTAFWIRNNKNKNGRCLIMIFRKFWTAHVLCDNSKFLLSFEKEKVKTSEDERLPSGFVWVIKLVCIG